MGEFDYNSSAGGFGMNPMMFGMMPGPQYNPLGSGNPSIDHAFAVYGAPMLQQFLGGNKFLPQQFPAQGLLDQMAAAKYMRASKANEHHARQHIDQKTIYQNLVGIHSKFDATPLSDTGKAQYETAASYINSEGGQMAASMLFGAQNAEDLFFGRKGSAVQLAGAVNKIGYYRPDSVSGQDRMSEDSLKEFSNQLYSNLYGLDADLNDVSGFSAGRVGGIMTELARRGLLPESVSKLSASGRAAALGEKGMDKLGLSKEVTDAISSGSSLEEIEKIPDGASGIRKIDATRVSNSLKGYTDALSVVREIFGDNGITNAPMQQLMAAMEALTQGGTSTMKAGAIENLMRRTQMASRDSGVSLEGLMGLSARSGALADQYGLSREVASENVVSSMERVRAMQDTGGFRPGFGRLDPTKAGMFALDQGIRADASRVGQYASAAARIVAENEGNGGFKGTRMRAMVNAMKRGESSFYDASTGRSVNINEELGRNPDAFMGGLLAEAGISAAHFGALVRDPGSQEYLAGIAGGLAGAQSVELKEKIGLNAVHGTGLLDKLGKGMSEGDRDALAAHFSRGFSTTVIDTVNTTMSATGRLDALEGAARQSFKDYIREKNPTATDAQVSKMADQMINDRFGGKQGLREELSQQYAAAGAMTEAEGYGKLSTLQQMNGARGIDEFERRRRINKNRAGVMDNARVGDGSNFLQRFSDMLGGSDARPALEQLFNTVDSFADQEKLLEGIAGGKDNAALRGAFKEIQNAYSAGTVDTDAERAELMKRAATDFASVKDQFKGTGAEAELQNKTKYMTSAQLAASMERNYSGKENYFKALYQTHFKDKDGNDMTSEALDAMFSDSATRKKAMEELAGKAGVDATLAANGIRVAGDDVMTEANLRRLTGSYDPFAVGADRERVAALGKLGKEFDSGSVTSKSVLGALGASKAAIDDEQLNKAMQAYINNEKDSTIGAVGGRLGELGITGDKAAEIINTTQFSKNLKELGGFDSLGTATFAERAAAAGRKEAIDSRVKKGEITGKVADAIKKKENGDTLKPEEQALITNAYKGDNSDLDVSDAVKKEKGSKAAALADMEKEAKSITAKNTGAGSASDPSGIGTAVANAIGALFKDVFKGEMKFDNVTIASVKVLSGIDQLAAKTEKDGGEVKLSGSIKLEGLEAGVADLIARSNSDDAPTPAGGTPVKNPPRADSSRLT
jgi:hypothetical protein